MIVVPFIYFGFLLLYRLKKNNWHIDIASFILIIFTVSSFFSILIDVFNLRSIDTSHYKISVFACISYISLITLCIFPFMHSSNLKVREIQPISNEMGIILKIAAWIFFLYLFFNLIMSWESLVAVITSDDIERIRKLHGTEMADESWMASLTPTLRMPFVLLNLMSGSTWIFVFLAFFCMIIQRMKFTYFILFILSSFNGIIGNILDAGRSAIAYWGISFLACYIIYTPYMRKDHKKVLKRLFVIIGVFAFMFIAAVTISRFGYRDAGEVSGTQGGLISYFGQTYINFCFFLDEFSCPFPSLQIVFPFLSKLILGDGFVGVVDLQELISMSSGREIGVFYTFLGHIMVTSNAWIMLIYALLLSSCSLAITHKTQIKSIRLSTFYFYYLYSSVIFLGIFTHYYAGTTRTFSVAFWGILLMLISKKGKTKELNFHNHGK